MLFLFKNRNQKTRWNESSPQDYVTDSPVAPIFMNVISSEKYTYANETSCFPQIPSALDASLPHYLPVAILRHLIAVSLINFQLIIYTNGIKLILHMIKIYETNLISRRRSNNTNKRSWLSFREAVNADGDSTTKWHTQLGVCAEYTLCCNDKSCSLCQSTQSHAPALLQFNVGFPHTRIQQIPIWIEQITRAER